MKPGDYEAWYHSPRGKWIGESEFALMKGLLRPEPGASLLDVGCGSGHFTRLFAREIHGTVIGLDPNLESLSYARLHEQYGESYVAGRAEALPFPDRAFQFTTAVTSLCFVSEQKRALRELLRVTHKRFVLGLLNRHSLLYLEKGRSGGAGGYAGAHWHTSAEVGELLESLPVANVVLRTAIVLPRATSLAKAVDACWPRCLPFGGFLAVAGEVTG